MRTVLATIAAAAALCAAASAEPIRAVHGLVLSDFARPGAAARWSGIGVERTGAPGAWRGRIRIPKHVEGAEPRPSAILAWDRGRGYPTRDFRPYGTVAVDATVEGSAPCKLALKLRDGRKNQSWSTWVTLEPGKRTRIALTTSVAAADIDVADVQQVVLYAKEPAEAASVLIGSVRLEPRKRPPLASFRLAYPNYRGLIIPGDGDPQVVVDTEAREYGLRSADLRCAAELRCASRVVVVQQALRGRSGRLTLPAGTLPDGPAELTVSVHRGRGPALAKQTWTVRKLTRTDVAGLRSYVDRWGNLIVDGRPFFPLGFYDGFSEESLASMAAGGFNCVINYGVSNLSTAALRTYLDVLASHGMKSIFNIADLFPNSEQFTGRQWEGLTDPQAVTAAMIDAFRDHPAVISWYLNEELVSERAAQLRAQYQKVSALDPTRPCSMVHCNRHVVPDFADTTDIFGMDPYPVPSEPLTRVSEFLDVVRRGTGGSKSMWLVPETFAWYQFDSKAKNKDRGRIPTARETLTGRPPTPEEMRCMVYLGLAHGARGLIGFSYYNMRVLPQFEQMWAGLRQIAAEVRQLTPALMARADPLPVRIVPAASPVHTRLMRHDGRYTLIAVNTAKAPCRATIDVGRPLDPRVEALFEAGSARAEGSRVTLSFRPYEARVLELRPRSR